MKRLRNPVDGCMMDIVLEPTPDCLWKELKKLVLENGKSVEVSKRILKLVAEIEDEARDTGYYIGRCDA